MKSADEIVKKLMAAFHEEDAEEIIKTYQELTEHLNQAVIERDLILSNPVFMVNLFGAECFLEAIGPEAVGKWFMGLGSI